MDYYQILGVKYSANHAEIRRAYRRLAVLYHPDKNRDPNAENIFKEINAAYDVLGDPSKKSIYDLRFQSHDAETFNEAQEPRRHRDPAYRSNRSRVYHKSDRERLRDLMAEYMPWAKRVTLFCFAFSVLMVVDYILPNQLNQETIIGTASRRTYSRNYATSWWVIKTDGGHTIDLPYEFSTHFLKGKEVDIYSSLIFDVSRKVETEGFAVRLKKSIYGNFIFAPMALLFFSSLGLYFRKNIEYGFNMSVTSFLILIFTWVILLTL